MCVTSRYLAQFSFNSLIVGIAPVRLANVPNPPNKGRPVTAAATSIPPTTRKEPISLPANFHFFEDKSFIFDSCSENALFKFSKT